MSEAIETTMGILFMLAMAASMAYAIVKIGRPASIHSVLLDELKFNMSKADTMDFNKPNAIFSTDGEIEITPLPQIKPSINTKKAELKSKTV